MDREKIDENDLFEQFEVTQHKNLFRAFSSESWSFKEFLEEFVLGFTTCDFRVEDSALKTFWNTKYLTFLQLPNDFEVLE